jgi:hypothetical protein
VYGGAHSFGGLAGSQPVVPSELAQQLVSGLSSHVKPLGQSLASVHATTVSLQIFVVLGSHVQSGGVAPSLGGAAPPSSAGTPPSASGGMGAAFASVPPSLAGVGLPALPLLLELPLPVPALPAQPQLSGAGAHVKPLPQSESVSQGGT